MLVSYKSVLTIFIKLKMPNDDVASNFINFQIIYIDIHAIYLLSAQNQRLVNRAALSG
jgi:hypothetical protein